ncbi:ferritin-like protein [Nocardiopsis sp. NPDC050513]|uniref:ferritin-like protein n=1 Tax=Nocardiopsis sp. NPDC050513 TaxID=3364338 RepID=UPI00378EF746
MTVTSPRTLERHHTGRVRTYPTPGLKKAVEGSRKRITDRATLFHFLQCALEVELTTIPPYMLAMYSMRPGRNEEAFYTIRGVVLEEMLHMTLVANIMTAVGATPSLAGVEGTGAEAAAVNAPVYPCVLPFTPTASKPIVLRPFSKEAMSTFIAIEGPDEPKGKPPSGWRSIGHFYDVIRQGIEDVAAKDALEPDPEKQIFPTDRKERKRRLDRQIGPEHFYNSGGEVIRVTDPASAKEAMDIVVEQGEGLHHTIFTSDDVRFGEERQVSHYFRFLEIFHGRRYSPYDLPDQPPGGEVVDVDWNAVYPVDVIDTDAKRKHPPGPLTKRYHDPSQPQLQGTADQFNRAYTRLLAQCHVSFNGSPDTLEQAVPTMLELRYLAEELFRNPLPRTKGGPRVYACPTFEVSGQEMARQLKEVQADAERRRKQREKRAKDEQATRKRMAERS